MLICYLKDCLILRCFYYRERPGDAREIDHHFGDGGLLGGVNDSVPFAFFAFQSLILTLFGLWNASGLIYRNLTSLDIFQSLNLDNLILVHL